MFGSVNVNERGFEFDRHPPDRPMQTRVRLSGRGEARSTLSAGGRFEFAGLEPGAYRLDLEVPGGYSTYVEGRNVQLPNLQSCAREDYVLSPAGRITGHLVGPDGRVLVQVKVEATAAVRARIRCMASPPPPQPPTGTAASRFVTCRPASTSSGSIWRTFPVSYNPYARTVYPSNGSGTHVVNLALGQTHDLGTWRLPPPVRVVKVEGVVVWQDGTPAAGLWIGAWDRTGNPTQFARGAGSAKTGADGRFVMELRQGRVYTFSAAESDNQPAVLAVAAPRIETTGPVGPVRIVIRGDR